MNYRNFKRLTKKLFTESYKLDRFVEFTKTTNIWFKLLNLPHLFNFPYPCIIYIVILSTWFPINTNSWYSYIPAMFLTFWCIVSVIITFFKYIQYRYKTENYWEKLEYMESSNFYKKFKLKENGI